MGRTKKDDPRDYRVNLRLSSVERERLEKYCEKHNKRRATAVMEAIFEKIESEGF